ncbi:MAG: HlyC/CorC family transporter [Holophaga sp.]|nr:HlyC/CorC family transporter [Holophaga sp.]
MIDQSTSLSIPTWLPPLAGFLLLYRAAMASLLEAFHALPSLQRRRLLEEDSIPDPLLARLLERPHVLGLGIALWNQVLLVALLALLWPVQRLLPGGIWSFLALALIYVWAMDLALPTLLTGAAPATWIIRFFPLYAPAHRALAPLLAPLARYVERQRETQDREREAIDEEPSDDAVTALLEEGEAEGILEEEDRELIRNVVSFADTVVREVMTPRTSIQAIDAEATPDEVWEVFRASRHSRLPLVSGSPDDVIGVVLLKDLVQTDRGQTLDLRALARPALFVPESKHILELLRELQRTRNQIAIVVDEFGSVSGLVTLEDLLEEVFGEIREEHESAPDIQEIDKDCWLVSGKVHIEDLEAHLEVQWERDGFDTVAGLVMARLGRVPRLRESIVDQGVRFTVTVTDGPRLLQVKVERV